MSDDIIQDILDEIRQKERLYSRAPDVVKPKVGVTRARLLPSPIKGQLLGEQKWGEHWIRNAQGKAVTMVGCRAEAFGENCPVCNAVDRVLNSARDDDVLKIVKSWRARAYVLLCVSLTDVTGQKKPRPTDYQDPVALALTKSTFDDFFAQYKQVAQMGINPFDVNNGRDLMITRVGSGQNDTRYTPTFAPVDTSINPDLLERRINLREYVERSFTNENRALNSIQNIATELVGLPGQAPLAQLSRRSDIIDIDVNDAPAVTKQVINQDEIEDLLNSIE